MSTAVELKKKKREKEYNISGRLVEIDKDRMCLIQERIEYFIWKAVLNKLRLRNSKTQDTDEAPKNQAVEVSEDFTFHS